MCVQNKLLDLQKHVQQQRQDFPNFLTLLPPVQSNGGGREIQVQTFVFLTSELTSTHNFSLENMFYSYFWDISYFHTFGSQVGVRSQTLSYMFLCCLFVCFFCNLGHSIRDNTRTCSLCSSLRLRVCMFSGVRSTLKEVAHVLQTLLAAHRHFQNQLSSAPQRSLPAKSHFQYTQGTLFTIYLLPRDPSNFPRWWPTKVGGLSPLLRTLLCMLRDEVLQIK